MVPGSLSLKYKDYQSPDCGSFSLMLPKIFRGYWSCYSNKEIFAALYYHAAGFLPAEHNLCITLCFLWANLLFILNVSLSKYSKRQYHTIMVLDSKIKINVFLIKKIIQMLKWDPTSAHCFLFPFVTFFSLISSRLIHRMRQS